MRKTIVLLLVLLSLGNAKAQNGNALPNIPMESIYLHQNTTFLLSGEYLYYKVYCFNNETGMMSDLSKMAYVEMVGADGKAVFSHKVALKNGMGQGDFFIPTSVASGNYKVIAYTQWMRNGGSDIFFDSDLMVINPFQSHQNSGGSSTSGNGQPDLATGKSPRDGHQKVATTDLDQSNMSFELNKEVVDKRSKIGLTLSKVPERWFGAYSLSVRRIESFSSSQSETSFGFKKKEHPVSLGQNPSSGGHQKLWLPELRGELISGRIESTDPALSIADKLVALSIPGTNYLFKIARTRSEGQFTFSLDRPYLNEGAILQVVGEDRDAYRIELDSFESPDLSHLDFEPFELNEEMEELILQHSIQNQVQNAYAGIRVDSVRTLEDFPPFYRVASHEYLLDDYTRFPTIRETILEVVEQASTRQRKGEQYIHVRVYDDNVESGLQSLLLIDGMFIQDHNTVVEAKSSKIKKISVVNEQFLYGSEVFEGIISMESYEGDFIESLPQLRAQQTPLFRPEIQKNYFRQDYTYPKRYARIPDYRTQLAWEPEFVLDASEKEYWLYTSDIQGTYEVIIEGFSHNGQALSLRKTFQVK